MPEYKLAFIGFGNVGRALARLLLEKRQELNRRCGVEWRAVALATGRHGTALDPQGLDLGRALALAKVGASLAELSPEAAPPDTLDLIRSCRADVLFETTPVNYETGQPAVDHLRAALGAGMHAITANKGPVVHAYPELRQLAATRGRRFLFESAVMDGAPIFSLWRTALPGARLLSFRGILNSTTNLILGLMEQGRSFDEAVAHAQAIGIAETDPSGDILGWDAAVKVAALVTVLMGVPLKPHDVRRKGIEDLSPAAVRSALRAGHRWKLVCEARWEGERPRARVAPEQIEPGDPLHSVDGTSSAVTFHTDVLGPLTIREENPGPRTTAYGLLADFLSAVVGEAEDRSRAS
jgi:homoserine dehydrogenase